MMKVGLVDMGSNTMRMNIYKVLEEDVELLFTVKQNAGLASYVKNKKMTKVGFKKAVSVLNKFMEIVESFELDQFHVFATASLRNIDNTKDAVDYIEEKTKLPIRVLSGEEEAMLDFAGATRQVKSQKGIVVDIGGASTQLVSFNENGIQKALSMPMGSLSLHSEFVSRVLPSSSEIKEISKYIKSEVKKIRELFPKEYSIICGVGGTVRAAGKVCNRFQNEDEERTKISTDELIELLEFLEVDIKEGMGLILKVCPDRIHTLIPGMLILNELINTFSSKSLIVSKFGVREGYLFERILGEANGCK